MGGLFEEALSTQHSALFIIFQEKPWLKVFINQMSVAKARPTSAGSSRLCDSLGRAIESTLLGKSSAQKALQEAQKRVELVWEF